MLAPLRIAFCFLTLLIFACNAHAAAHSSATVVSAIVEPATLRPGDSAMVTVTIEVKKGLHAQSHAPIGDGSIPFVLSVENMAGLTVGDVRYPPSQEVNYPQLGKLSIYTGSVTFTIPITIHSNAANGPMTIRGAADFQACNDDSCFPPETLAWTATATIAGGASTQAAAATIPTSQSAQTSVNSLPKPNSPKVFGVDLDQAGLPVALGLAFVVGIIFNAMPCVLPVVPLKILGFYEVSKHHRGRCFQLGLIFSAGLVFVFAILALLVVGLQVIDWGGLFQQRWFNVAIVLVLLAMAVGTFGLFNVPLPTSLYSIAPRHDTASGNFLFGMLTALLSTPCTFGVFLFLLGWMLRQPVAVGCITMITVGVGMAFPYLLLSAFPQWARRFPRTGPWAELVKQLMAFFLLGTAVYFAKAVLGSWVTQTQVFWAIFWVIAAAGGFLIVRTLQLSHVVSARLIAVAIALVMVAPSLALTLRLTSQPYKWEPFTDDVLQAARKLGRPVVIDFTADWCGNCHWLEAAVLHDPAIVKIVRNRDVLMLQADVTQKHSVAEPLLLKLNPTGSIPLTAVYVPNESQPRLLNGIYDVADLKATLP